MDYDMYFERTLALCQTLTIKSEDSIRQINTDLQLRYGATAVDTLRPETWKYYKNICGLEHSTDTPMTVVSVDTLETMAFTKNELVFHPETRVAYAFGTSDYAALVKRYPTQEQLILGILYPADLNTALDAPDGTILAYPAAFVEPQEVTLIEELSAWIRAYLERWHVRAFSLSDTLYATAHHGLMYLQLMPQVLNLRLKRCKTAEAHSFHIQSYLASHGRLDRYLDDLTLSQQLFLYRNIAYIERNAGKDETFNWLVERLLSARQIPIAAYSVRHTGGFDAAYWCDYRLRKTPLNTPYNTPEQMHFELDEVLSKEAPLTVGNAAFITEHRRCIDRKFSQSLSSVVQTKALESSMIDYSGSDAVPFVAVLLQHWGYFSSIGVYTAPIRFKHPITKVAHVLDSETAFSYLQYLTLQKHGIPITHVPRVQATRVRRHPKPLPADLASVVDNQQFDGVAIATRVLATQPVLTQLRTRTAFFDCCSTLYEESLKHTTAVANTHHLYARALLENLIHRLYADCIFSLKDTGMPIETWLSTYQLPPAPTIKEETDVVITALFSAGTGYNPESNYNLKAIQTAMSELLLQLSSYSIQLIREINTQPLQLINWAAIRFGDTRHVVHHTQRVNNAIRVIKTTGKSKITQVVDQAALRTVFNQRTWQMAHVEGVLSSHVVQLSKAQYQGIGILSPAVFRYSYPGANASVIAQYGAVGYETYLALTPDQRAQLVSIYSDRNTPIFPTIEP